MKIQVTPDTPILVMEIEEPLTDYISNELNRFNKHITHLKVKFSNNSVNKQGTNNKHCLIEAYFTEMQPIIIRKLANTHEDAVIGALDNLKNSLDLVLGRRMYQFHR